MMCEIILTQFNKKCKEIWSTKLDNVLKAGRYS